MKVREVARDVTKGSELKRYTQSTWVDALFTLFLSVLLVGCAIRIVFRDGVFQPRDWQDWLYLSGVVVLSVLAFSYVKKLVPIWWERYWHRPVLFCQYFKVSKKFHFFICSRRLAKKKMEDLATADEVIRVALPLYGLRKFFWGEMSWFDWYKDCRFSVRLFDTGDQGDIENCLRIEVKDKFGNKFTNLYFNCIPDLAIINSDLTLAEVAVRLSISNLNYESLKNKYQISCDEKNQEISKLKIAHAEKYNNLNGVSVHSRDAFLQIMDSSRFKNSVEAGEVCEELIEIMEFSWEPKARDLADCKKKWEKSELKAKLEKHRARKKETPQDRSRRKHERLVGAIAKEGYS